MSKISVRQIFVLFSEDSGAMAGNRLFRGNDPKTRYGEWPFKEGNAWVMHDNKKDADAAALKLQNYLDSKGKKKK